MNVVAIIEARMTSTRLPGKHLLEANGKPMLQHLLNRLKHVPSINCIVIATTVNEVDDVICNLAIKNNINYYRGSEDDVMGRVLDAAKAFSADVICEVTGDCPIIDPELVEQIIKTFINNNVDYVNNGKSGLPDGMSAQVFTTKALESSASLTKDPLDREHVTLHIKRHPELYRAIYMTVPKSLQWPSLGLVLDEKRDYFFLKKIIEYYGDNNEIFNCNDVIRLVRNKKDWLLINQDVVRKGDT